MQTQQSPAAICSGCGTRLTGGFSNGLGHCMVCLLRLGFEDEDHAARDDVDPLEFDRLGTYRIARHEDGRLWELGRGAMGVTYRALDTSLQRPVALKLIEAEWVKRGAEARERFMREARAAAALRHPNVATVYQFGVHEESGQYFCAMELVEGETLEERVRRTGPLAPLTVIEIALQVSSALTAAEKQGLVHRDLKPANLMLVTSDSEEGAVVVKVIDFGVAKALAENPAAMGLTHGGFVGTPAFASPEQFSGVPVDVRSDIYSLGVALCYALTGQMPFPGGSIEEIRAHRAAHAVPLAQLKAARLSGNLISLLIAMLALEPAARPGVRRLTVQLQSLREQLAHGGKRVRRLGLVAVAIAGSACAALYFLLPLREPDSPSDAAFPVPEKSIAVLPFENLSPDQANAFFADGIQDDVTVSLAKIQGLHVISRASLTSYRDKSRRNLRQIRKELGVANVLEGSVRRVGNRMLVNVELIDTATHRHVWAERYDRTLADSISLQGELASEIAGALRANLSVEETARLESKATDNPEAYVFYLRGRELQLRPEVSREQLLNAESLYQQALELDPKFVLARARLSTVQATVHDKYEFPNPARLAEGGSRLRKARANAEEALRLDSDSAEAHQALAWCAQLAGEETVARREASLAVELRPNDSSIRAAVASVMWYLGRDEEAAVHFKRAIELSPREAKIIFNYGGLLRSNAHEAEARSNLDRALVLAPESIYYRLYRADAEICWTGDISRARSILAGLPGGQDPDGRVTAAYFALALWERNFSEAFRLLEAYPGERLPPSYGGGVGEPYPKRFQEGLVAAFAGDRQRAFECLDSIRWEWEVDVRDKPSSAADHCGLAMIYGFMGWKDAAMAEIARVLELEQAAGVPAKDRRHFNLAQIYGWLSERDLAFAQLEQYFAAPRIYYTRHNFRLDPIWDPLRGDPRFEALVSSFAPKETAFAP